MSSPVWLNIFYMDDYQTGRLLVPMRVMIEVTVHFPTISVSIIGGRVPRARLRPPRLRKPRRHQSVD